MKHNRNKQTPKDKDTAQKNKDTQLNPPTLQPSTPDMVGVALEVGQTSTTSQASFIQKLSLPEQQTMLSQLGQTQGNQYVQRVIESIHDQKETESPASDNQNEEAPTLTEATPTEESIASEPETQPTAAPPLPTSETLPQPQSYEERLTTAQQNLTEPIPDQLTTLETNDQQTHLQPTPFETVMPTVEAENTVDLTGLPQNGPLGEYLTQNTNTQPAGFGDVSAGLRQNAPDLIHQEQQQILQSLPTQLRTPLGLPTLPEINDQEGLAQPETPEATLTELETPQVDPETLSPSPETIDSQTVNQTYQTEQQATAQTQDAEKQATSPDQAQTHTHTNTSAGPRPQVDLNGPTNPNLVTHREQTSALQMNQLAEQATQATQQDDDEHLVYPQAAPEMLPVSQEATTPDLDIPEPETEPTWENVTAEMAEQPQIEQRRQQQEEKYQATINYAQQETEAAIAQQAGVEQQQAEIDQIGGELHFTDAISIDDPLQERVDHWLDQESDATGQLDTRQENLLTTQNEAQAVLTEAEAGQAQLPDTPELGQRLAANSDFEEAITAEVQPDFEADRAQMLDQYQQQETTHQEAVQQQWAEAETFMAEHKTQQQETLAQIQSTAETDVAQMKTDWQAQNEQTLATHRAEVATTRQQNQQFIHQTVTQGESDIDQLLTQAEGQALQTKSDAETQATDKVAEGRSQAAGRLSDVAVPMSSNYESNAVGTIMRRDEEGELDAEAERQAEIEAAEAEAQTIMDQSVEDAQAILDQMETDVQAILDDATLTAAEKVSQVNDVVQQAIEDANQVMDDLDALHYGPLAPDEIDRQQEDIQNRINEAVADASEAMFTDEVVAERVAEIEEQITDGTGNILFDTSNIDGGWFGRLSSALFRARMMDSIQTLMTRPAGLDLIMQLVDSGHTVTITASNTPIYGGGQIDTDPANFDWTAATDGTGTDSSVLMDPAANDNTVVVNDIDGNEIADPVYIFLGHELIHSLHAAQGNIDITTRTDDYHNEEEFAAIADGEPSEEDLREQFGLPVRVDHIGRDTQWPR